MNRRRLSTLTEVRIAFNLANTDVIRYEQSSRIEDLEEDHLITMLLVIPAEL